MHPLHRPSSSLPARLSAALLAAILAGCGGGSGGNGGSVDTGGAVGNQPTVPVNPGTPANAPSLTGNTATDGYAWFNYRRSMLGMSALTRNTSIDTAALGHSRYLQLNNTVSHSQEAGKAGFTGVNLDDRLAAGGYTLVRPYAAGEVISAASNTSGFYHAEELIAAIYHRFVIFEPVFREIGTGAVTASGTYTYFTADLTASGGLGTGLGAGKIAVYPTDNQTAVPTNFLSDNEEPDPVPNQNEVGYPISVHADSGRTGDLTVDSFTVAPRGGAALTTRLLSQATDSATGAKVAAIVPLTVLRANTTYDVSFRGTVHGVTVAHDWSFTTR
ncbi:MAG: CAP domain-containing protein [Duganella sp.]